jgi:5'-nucleotidase
MEGLMAGVRSMAVSLASFSSDDFEPAALFVRDWLDKFSHRSLPQPTLLNVNVPPLPASDICGIVLAPLGLRHYSETFERRIDPRGKTYYWIAGEAIDTDAAPDSDIAAIQDNYITVTPLHFNLTAHADFAMLMEWGLTGYHPSPPLE